MPEAKGCRMKMLAGDGEEAPSEMVVMLEHLRLSRSNQGSSTCAMSRCFGDDEVGMK